MDWKLGPMDTAAVGGQPASKDYADYHDHEWGFPVGDDQRLFEKICLEGFQAGLSWLTILRKRENFRRAFSDFDFTRIARFNSRSVERCFRTQVLFATVEKLSRPSITANAPVRWSSDMALLPPIFGALNRRKRQRP